MRYRNLGDKAHALIHFLSVAGIAVGLPFSKAVMSIGMMLGILNLFIEGRFKVYIQNLRGNIPFLLIASLYLIHVLALLWTSDFDYAMNDLRIKLPLLVIPIILFSKPIDNNHTRDLILHLFVVTLFITSTYNYLAFKGLIGDYSYNDIRGLSLFGSHIRYGILIALGAMICIWYVIKQNKFRALHLTLFLWFIYYTWFSQIISGFLGLSAGLIALIFILLYERKKLFGYLFIGLVLLIPLVLVSIVTFGPEQKLQKVDPSELPLYTSEGNPYVHSLVEQRDSKGNYLFINLCEEELEREWNKVSHINYDSTDIKGQRVSFTLIRYMTSLELKKDAEGFKKLSKEDIHRIENGIAEFGDSQTGLLGRLNGVKFQLQGKDDPNGYSLLQRLEYWKTGWHIIKENWLLGVGTGDVKVAFDQQYEKDQSALYPENRLRAHNSYLTFWISFGIGGLLLFLYSVYFYLKTSLRLSLTPAFIFMAIATITFLLEDTLETQTGVTFFAFFYAFFLMEKRINS